MDNMIFISENNLFINLDQVISVEFVPTHQRRHDENTTVMVVVPDMLTIVTTAIELGQVDGYDGEFKGVSSVSQKIKIVGPKAKRLFERLRDYSEVLSDEVPTSSEFPF